MCAILTACTGRSQDTGPEPASSAVVQVENQGFTDMVIYAISGGQRVRLGLATGNSTKTFTVPLVRRGDVVTLTIPPQ